VCLAVPMQVVEINGDRGRVSTWGVELEVALDLVDDVTVGDYVIVHAGFAIQSLPAEEALETLAILEKLEMS
jgi:hydrogenase expression/formation protein HypC